MNTSLQLSFINNKYGHTISLLRGKSLMEQVYGIHNIGPHAKEFYDKTILGAVQLINFLKPLENLGFYIDSEEPYFRFKIEMSHHGTLRTLLLPEDFDSFPTKFTGKCRVHKIIKGQSPYTSIVDYQDFALEDIPNEVMDKSYQTQSKIFIADNFHNSLMLTKLPPTNIDLKIEDFDDILLTEFELKNKEFILSALNSDSTSIAEIESLFAKNDFSYLGSKEIKFHCPCSKERMVDNVFTLSQQDREDLFAKDPSIEIRCDYCNTLYDIRQEDILRPVQ